MSTDLTERLTALRPAPGLTADEADAMVSGILDSDRSSFAGHRSPRRRRIMVGSAVVVLAAAAAIVVPTVLPSSAPLPPLGHASPAAAAQLRRLAVVVENGRSVTLGRHRYLYIAETEVQTGLIGYEPNGRTVHGMERTHRVRGTSITHRQGWTSRTGRLWRRDDTTNRIEGHSVDDYVIAPNDVDSPKHFASLPTDPGKLNAYLRSEFGPSSDTNRNVFEQIESILQTGIAPAAVRSAALQVLARTDHVTVAEHVRDSRGRRAERFSVTYRSQGKDEQESVYLDPRDAQVLETTSGGFGDSFVDTVRAERVVDSVPPAVTGGASRHK